MGAQPLPPNSLRNTRFSSESTDLWHAQWFATGENQSGVPRGYDPLVAGRGFIPRPRRGGREPRWNGGDRRKGESEAVPPPSRLALSGMLLLLIFQTNPVWQGRSI
jgi:hypothetical protein